MRIFRSVFLGTKSRVALSGKQFLRILCINFTMVLSTHASVGQLLTDYFFQNPADLNAVAHQQVILGNFMIAPSLQFQGTAPGGTGSARSSVVDALPYLLADIRLTDKFVVGLNAVPSEYGDLSWPLDSIVAHDSTTTKIYYYILGLQSSYQFTDRLVLGLGLNLRYNYLAELDSLVGNLGNEVNKVSALNNGMDAGLTYKLTPKHTFIATFYSPVNRFGKGTSTLNGKTSYNFGLNIVEAAVIFMGMQHQFTERWYLQEKIFWSQWTVQNNTVLRNTTRGTIIYPTNWGDTWSYLVATEYKFIEKIAGLASVMYETNPAPNSTNAIGYPLAPTLFISAGIDFSVLKNVRMQLVYGFGFFIPKAVIDNSDSHGRISANTQVGVLQLVYKL